MPFTLSHTVVAIPFLRHRRLFEPVALVIGTMAPDAGYFIAGLPKGHASHTFAGSFLTALPVGLILWILVALIGRRASCLLPGIFRTLLLSVISGMREHRSLLLLIPSLWIGIASHNFIDALTHPSGWFVERLPFLQKSLGTFPLTGELPLFHLLQHLGTILGVLCLGVLAGRQLRRTPFTAPDWNKVAVGSLVLLISFLIVLPGALALSSRFQGSLAVRVLVVEAFVTTISQFMVIFVSASLIWSLRDMRRG